MAKTPTPAQIRDALQVAQRLNHADLWPQAVRVYASVAEHASAAVTGEVAVEAAWAAFQAEDLDACRDFLKRAPESLPQTQMLSRACAAAAGDDSAYHAVLAEAMHGAPNPVLNITGLLLACWRDDVDAAGVLARRVLAVAPSHGASWMALAVNSAVTGDEAEAVAAVSNARRDRYPVQQDPALSVTERVSRVLDPDAAASLTAAGALLDPAPRTGWDGWPSMLRQRMTFALAEALAGTTALIFATTLALLLLGMPLSLAAPSVLAILVLVWLATKPRDSDVRGPQTSLRTEMRMYRAWAVGALRAARTAVTGWATRVPGSAAEVLHPNRCVCHLNSVITGSGAADYVREHLRRVPDTSSDLGYTLVSCPVINRSFIHPDGLDFAVIAPDEVGPDAVASKRPEPVNDSELRTGQYL